MEAFGWMRGERTLYFWQVSSFVMTAAGFISEALAERVRTTRTGRASFTVFV